MMAVVDRLDQEICDQADDQKSRQNAGLAIEWLRSCIDVTLKERSPVSLLFNGMSKDPPLFGAHSRFPTRATAIARARDKRPRTSE